MLLHRASREGMDEEELTAERRTKEVVRVNLRSRGTFVRGVLDIIEERLG
jgi:hypothetical protein